MFSADAKSNNCVGQKCDDGNHRVFFKVNGIQHHIRKTLKAEKGKQKIEHIQEDPCYKREYLLQTDTPLLVCKIFVIDDGTHSTMLLAEEY